eukprot:gnl/MRDRNA2_/MRDRNA2_96220_c0_seq1.p1 gnl/MRDRNA2_/MRDRNA2_96220_c0~~gnl/MRDRNA2_/MRDRNA2_96220_c0_seq1.p1  ORF type:complete len:130 (+),score=20.98 gnl/MRDRNA2_/MRDRNA2_96220_c0_seq1:61-450(+)
MIAIAASSAGCLSAVALNKLIEYFGRPVAPVHPQKKRKADSREDDCLVILSEVVLESFTGTLIDAESHGQKIEERTGAGRPSETNILRDLRVNFWQKENAKIRATLQGAPEEFGFSSSHAPLHCGSPAA